MNEFRDMLYNSLSRFVNRIAEASPSILAALVILVVGWLLAKLVRLIVIKALLLTRLNIIAWKTGIDGFLQRAGVKYNLVQLIGQIFYWFFIVLVLVASVDALGLNAASDLLNRILFYIPNILVAILVLVLGLFLANFVSSVLESSLSNVGFTHPRLLALLAKYALIVFVAAIALEQLGVGQHIVVLAFTILFGAICLALALAFGLGGRAVAEKFLEKLSKEGQSPRKDAVIE